MTSFIHKRWEVGHGRPEHGGTSRVKNKLIQSGAAFGGSKGKLNNPFETSTTKTSKKESGRITEEKEKEKKKEIVKKKKKGGRTGIVNRRYKDGFLSDMVKA